MVMEAVREKDVELVEQASSIGFRAVVIGGFNGGSMENQRKP